ncbi:SPRY domain-containing protein 7 [Diachasmimorpha longicaudata]|uniref:SPRY domain-containing protein 7 n=1 Tax=Diachasmimorpha longicaudata TaxID=58733 RepID=UPI0030B8A795
MMFCCLRSCFNGLGFPGTQTPQKEPNPINLDTSHMGHEVVIVMNGLRACGQGCALTNLPLVQSKSYFEVKIRQDGIWAVGLATRSTDLNTSTGGNDAESWALNSTGIIRHNKEEVHKLQTLAQEGDIIGISFDHIELNFYVNGKPLEAPVMGIKGTVYPALYVDEGAILDLIPQEFAHTPPGGFEKIMVEQSLL